MIAAMPQSLSKVILHIIFSTKNREPWLEGGKLRDHRRGNMNQPIFVFEIFASFRVFGGQINLFRPRNTRKKQKGSIIFVSSFGFRHCLSIRVIPARSPARNASDATTSGRQRCRRACNPWFSALSKFVSIRVHSWLVDSHLRESFQAKNSYFFTRIHITP